MEPDRRRDVAGEDRLSLLPDDIICYILSFLPTENAVAASVLSKRFRYLFAFVPTIHLSLFTFQKHYRRLAMINGESMNDKEAEAACKFTSVVERMLTMQSSHIYKFHIDVLRPGEVDGSLVCSWISEAIRRNNIQKLEIYFGKRMNNIFLPSEIFQGRKLVSLKLLTEFELKFPELVDLPNLRLLHLGLLRFVGDEYFIGKAFAGCPVLEELDLCFIKSTGVRALNIQIPSLKKLSLCFCYGMNKFFIDTPNLLYFIYQDDDHTEISVKPLNSLVKACIRIMNILSRPPCRREKSIFSSLINGVVKTKSLNLQAKFLLDYSLPKFHMLTRVEVVDIHIDSNYGVLLEVIKDSMPALEFLVLKMYTGKLHEFDTLQTKPTFFFQHLTEVEIRDFRAHESVYKLVEYILLCGAALKRMTISPISETTSVCNELLSLERTSKTCQIVFNH